MRTVWSLVSASSVFLATQGAFAAPATLSLDTPWACSGGNPVSSDDSTEGYSALLMQTPGYSACQSEVFSCEEITTSDEILLDVKLPASLPNPYWVGDIGLFVDVPSAGLYNDWVGMTILTGLPTDEWVTVSIAPTQNMLNALSGSCSDATIKFALNTSAPNILIDNIRFKSSSFSMTMAIEDNADDGQFDPSLAIFPDGWSIFGQNLGRLYTGGYNPADWGGNGNGLATASFRFALSQAIPAGSTISDAWLSLGGSNTWNWDPTTSALSVGLELSPDAAPIEGLVDLPFTPTGRPVVSSEAQWPETGGLSWAITGYNETVNLAPLLQELVDTYGGLAAGAHVQFFVYGADPGVNGQVSIVDFSSEFEEVATLTVLVD